MSRRSRHYGDTVVPDSPGAWPELQTEIALLPEKYRVPIVLCYFEGLTHDQAAAQLGWPVGQSRPGSREPANSSGSVWNVAGGVPAC